MHNRRNFLKKIPVLTTLHWGGSSIHVEGMCRANHHSPVVDKEIVLVNSPGSQIPRPVPVDFIFRQLPSIREVPETISVELPWKIEITFRLPEKIYNPANAYLFGDSGVLIGRWTSDFTDIHWEFGERLRIDHRFLTRGLFESSIIELPDGRFARVMRGSNYTQPQHPGDTWLSFSKDQCRTWSNPVPFSFSSGEKFFTPADLTYDD